MSKLLIEDLGQEVVVEGQRGHRVKKSRNNTKGVQKKDPEWAQLCESKHLHCAETGYPVGNHRTIFENIFREVVAGLLTPDDEKAAIDNYNRSFTAKIDNATNPRTTVRCLHLYCPKCHGFIGTYRWESIYPLDADNPWVDGKSGRMPKCDSCK